MNTFAPMRIVHTESSCGWGGQEIRVLNEAAGMIRRGHAVTLLCPPESRIYQEAGQRGVPAAALPIGRKRLVGVRAIRQWIKANRPDVVNTHSSTDTWLVALAGLFLRNAPPMVRTRHISAPIPGNWPTRWLYRKATRHVVTTGEALRQQVIDETGVSPRQVTSVPTGVSQAFQPGDRPRARAQLGLPTDVFTIGIIATLRSWKGHGFLLEAFARLRDRSARLVIVGDGPQRNVLEKQVRDLGLAGRVTMPGNQREVLPWFQALDVFTLPSYANEGMPQAVMQAMACALPVISTPIGATTEAVIAEKTGVLVKPQDVESLHAALERLHDDVDLRHRLGQAAREHVLACLGEEAMLDRMEQVFRHALDASRPGS